jgi:hypothetical protein
MTKNEARQRNKEWAAALSEGRVIRHGPFLGATLTSYPTVDRAEHAIKAYRAGGVSAEIVKA